MQITITNVCLNDKNPEMTVFFDAFIQVDNQSAFILPGWKITDGKMYPPSRKSKGAYYQTVLCSPGFAKAIQGR